MSNTLTTKRAISLFKEFALTLLVLENSIKALIPQSPETTLGWRALEKAKMFIGKNIGLLTGDYPYADTSSPTSDKIGKSAISTEETIYLPAEVDTTIKKIKYLREKIKEVEDDLFNVGIIEDADLTEVGAGRFMMNIMSAGQDITYASSILGMELRRIKSSPNYFEPEEA